MGLFKRNKYDIIPKPENLKSLVTKYSSTIKLNGKVVVPKGYYFVLGKKGKALDVFDEGEHFFNASTLPYTCRKYDINNQKNKGTLALDGYFVAKNLRTYKFKTYRKVQMGTKAYGLFKVGVYGTYTFEVENVKEFMQSLLNVYDYIKTGEELNIIDLWLDELIVKTLERNNFMLEDVIANNPIIANTLKEKMSKLFSVAGLKLLDVEIYKYKLPKQYQKASDNAILKQQALDIAQNDPLHLLAPNEPAPKEIQEQKGNDDLSQPSTTLQDRANSYVPFGNFEIKQGEIDHITLNVAKNKKAEKKFVDLDKLD